MSAFANFTLFATGFTDTTLSYALLVHLLAGLGATLVVFILASVRKSPTRACPSGSDPSNWAIRKGQTARVSSTAFEVYRVPSEESDL